MPSCPTCGWKRRTATRVDHDASRGRYAWVARKYLAAPLSRRTPACIGAGAPSHRGANVTGRPRLCDASREPDTPRVFLAARIAAPHGGAIGVVARRWCRRAIAVLRRLSADALPVGHRGSSAAMRRYFEPASALVAPSVPPAAVVPACFSPRRRVPGCCAFALLLVSRAQCCAAWRRRRARIAGLASAWAGRLADARRAFPVAHVCGRCGSVGVAGARTRCTRCRRASIRRDAAARTLHGVIARSRSA